MKTVIGALVLMAGMAFGDDGDPSSRVARLNYLSGSVSLQPAGADEVERQLDEVADLVASARA